MASQSQLEEQYSTSHFIWKIKNFSKLVDRHDSEVFCVGSLKWKVRIYPNGEGSAKDHLSLYLFRADSAVDNTISVHKEFSFAVACQTDPNKRVKKVTTKDFSGKNTLCWGLPSFMLLSELHHPEGMGRSRNEIKLKMKKRLQKCSSEKDSSSKDPENIGAAASSKKEEESREKPTTPSAPQVQRTATSNTVLAKSLPFSMDKSELIEFFKQAGEVVDARCNWDKKKRLYIEYATVEAANKALELDGQRNIRVYPVRLTTGASKILVAKNLKPSITKSQVIEFFKQAAVISDVRFSFTENGDFRGHCHIEFATEHGAKNAAKLNGEYLLDRPVVLGYARETIYVQGFDTSLGYHQIWNSLEELFSTCGQIVRMHIPTFPDTFVPRGMAFIEFFDIRDYPKGLAMNGHKLGDSTLKVEDACPPDLNVRPTGPRKKIRGKPVGPYKSSFYPPRYFRDRGYGGAGIGKQGSVYNFPPGKKIKFDLEMCTQ